MRLATFNILHGRSLRDGTVDQQRFAAAIKQLDPDILALQEVDRAQPRSHHADLTSVAAEAMGAVEQRFVPALTGTPGAVWAPVTEPDDPATAAYGVSLLSRYPALGWEVLELPRIPFRCPRVRHHPRRLAWAFEEPRAAVLGRFETPGGVLTAVCTHLSFVPGWGQLQLLAIRRALARVEGPVVLMGDLNLPGGQPARLTGYRSLARLPTMPTGRPTRQIDHILLRGGPGVVREADNPEMELSDHRALVVEVGLPGLR